MLRLVPQLKRRRISRDDVRKFIQERLREGVAPATTNQGLSVFKSIIRFGVREKKIKDAEIDLGSLALKKTTRD